MNLLCRVTPAAHGFDAAVTAPCLMPLSMIAAADPVKHTRRALWHTDARAFPGGVFRDPDLYAGGLANAAERI